MDANSSFARVPFVAAIRGPAVLITLGTLFALDYSAGIGLGKTWPVLLIVAGMLHLFGRASMRSGETMPGQIRPEEIRPGEVKQ